MNFTTVRTLTRLLVIAPMTAVVACQAPHHESTCDFLAAPERYSDSEREFAGQVIRTQASNYAFQYACNNLGSRRLPLKWRGGVTWEEGIFDEAGDPLNQHVGGGTVEGVLRRQATTGTWYIEALDYRRPIFTL